MKRCDSYWANIYVGLRPHYEKTNFDFMSHIRQQAIQTCQKYCDEVGLCVTVTDTWFIYKDGNEPGLIIGLINYPRFSTTKDRIQELSENLAQQLMKLCNQNRVSIVYPDETIMLENE